MTIKYLCSICSESNAVRLIIPTVIAPRYVAYGKQIALENVVAKTSYTIKLDMIYRGKDILSINSPTHKILRKWILTVQEFALREKKVQTGILL